MWSVDLMWASEGAVRPDASRIGTGRSREASKKEARATPRHHDSPPNLQRLRLTGGDVCGLQRGIRRASTCVACPLGAAQRGPVRRRRNRPHGHRLNGHVANVLGGRQVGAAAASRGRGASRRRVAHFGAVHVNRTGASAVLNRASTGEPVFCFQCRLRVPGARRARFSHPPGNAFTVSAPRDRRQVP